MISLTQKIYTQPLFLNETVLVGGPKIFPNMLAQLMAQSQIFTGAMMNHIEHHQHLYEHCPPYAPTRSVPAFENLTPNKGVDQSVMIDGAYRLDVTKNGKDSSTYKVYDKSGQELAGAWGDPHMTGKAGEAVGDMHGNHVLTLPNGAKLGIRVSDAHGEESKAGKATFCSEITATSANGAEAMNFNFNNGTDKKTTGSHISGYLGENFIAETLGDHGPFLGAQLGVSKEGGLFDPLTGQSMTAKRMNEIDLKNVDSVAREKSINLAASQQLFSQGYLTPADHRVYGNTSFSNFLQATIAQCIRNLQLFLFQMTTLNAAGCGFAIRLPNHIDSNRDIMLQSFGQLPKPYACPTLSASFNPALAGQMPEGAACKAIGVYLMQQKAKAVTLKDLGIVASDQKAPPIVRNACSFMMQHPDAWRKVETRDAGFADDRSGVWNFFNRAKDLGAESWSPIMTPPPTDFFYDR